MDAFVDGGLSFGSLFFHHRFMDQLDSIVERFVGGIYSTLSALPRSSVSDLTDAGLDGWKC